LPSVDFVLTTSILLRRHSRCLLSIVLTLLCICVDFHHVIMIINLMWLMDFNSCSNILSTCSRECCHYHWSEKLITHSTRFFFKENVRNLIRIYRDPISLIVGTRFSLILGTQIGSLKHLKKTLHSIVFDINRSDLKAIICNNVS